MVSTKKFKIVICSKCGNETLVYNNEKFILCAQCKSIKKIKHSNIES